MFLSFFRVIRFALQDALRTFGLSFMTVVVLVLMLLSINTLILVRVLTSEAVVTVKDQIDMTIIFQPTVTNEEITELQTFLAGFREVVTTTLSTAEEVLRDFKINHSDNIDIVNALKELAVNPFGPTMIVKTQEPEQYQAIFNALSVPEYRDIIRSKSFGDTSSMIERISTITTHVEYGVIALGAIFFFIALFVIFHTIRVAIYTQRTEIGIKKLVGATNWFIRGPYIVQMVMFSALSSALAVLSVHYAVVALDPFVAAVFEQPFILTTYLKTHILVLGAVEFCAVLFLTILTSLFAMRRYLRT